MRGIQRGIQYEVEALMRDLVAEVERRNGWLEDHSFHGLPLSDLQLMSWARVGVGMPLCKGDCAWLVDAHNLQPPQLAQVSRWFTNGQAEFQIRDDRGNRTPELRVLSPGPGVVLSLDERRPRYVGEHVILWGKRHCAALKGSIESIKAHAASATTCPDYRPLPAELKGVRAYCLSGELYKYESLVGSGACRWAGLIDEENLEGADSLLEGRSRLAVVTAVHPSDIFCVCNSKVGLHRRWQGDRGSTSTKDWWGVGELTQEVCGFSSGGKIGASSVEKGTRRLGAQTFSEIVQWTIGSVDLQIFDARDGTFTGPKLHGVPLFFVNGAGRTAAISQAQLVAQAELFHLFEDDLGNDLVQPASNRLLAAHGIRPGPPLSPQELASELCEWPSTIGVEPCERVVDDLLGLSEAADRENSLQYEVVSRFLGQYNTAARVLLGQYKGADPAWLSGQERFPDKLPEFEVTFHKILQDYDPDPHNFVPKLKQARNSSGVLRTDYLLW